MRSGGRRGQIALEAIIIIAFIFLLMLPLLYILFSRAISIQDEFRTLEVTRAVDTVASAISTVGVIGPNGTAVVEITLPDSLRNITIGNIGPNTSPREIVAVIGTTLGDIDIVRTVPYDVTGAIGAGQGRHKIRITYYEGGLPIRVSES